MNSLSTFVGKKATAFLLIGAFVLNVAGYLDAYRFMFTKQSSHHQKYLQKKTWLSVSTLKGEAGLAEKGFKRKEKDEYTYRGKWYDVVKKEKKGALTVFHFVHDSKEDELLHFLQSFFNARTATQSNRATVVLTRNLLKQYMSADKQLPTVSAGSKKHFIRPVGALQPAPFVAISLPPPQWIG